MVHGLLIESRLGGHSMQSLFGSTINLLSNMLDYRAARHKVIVSNVANINTPAYKPRDLVFEKTLQEYAAEGNQGQMIRTHSRHLDSGQEKGCNFRIIQSGDTVEIDKVMTDLAENNLMYNLTAELLLRKFNSLNTVLKEVK
jgi:flagellar basal-body rod protein FlgB